MEVLLNEIKKIIDLRMFGYKEFVEINNPSEEERIGALCSVADTVIDIATHVKDKMPNIDFVFNEKGDTVAKNIWLGEEQ